MAQWDYRKIDLNNVPRKTEDIDLLTKPVWMAGS